MERVLLPHPDISDAAVTGISVDESTELQHAFIVVETGSRFGEADVEAYMNWQVTSS